jgi:hypothetical protein
VVRDSQGVLTDIFKIKKSCQVRKGKFERFDGWFSSVRLVMGFNLIDGFLVTQVRLIVVGHKFEPLCRLFIVIDPLDCTHPAVTGTD